MKSKLIKAVIACAAAIVIGVGGYFGYKKLFPTKTVAVTSQYYGVNVRKMNLQQTIQGTGSAYAAVTKDIMPNNNGTLSDLSVKAGDTVTAGQKLFSVESDDLGKAVTTAQNNLTKANLTLSSDEKSKAEDDAKVAADKQAVSNAQAQLDAAKSQGNEGAISAAQSNLDKANQTLTNDLNAQTSDANKITMDKLSVSDAQAQLDQAKAQYDKRAVTAPFAGVVTAVNNSNGDSLQSGKAVLTIVDMTSMKIKVSVDELDIGKIKLDQTAAIKFDAIGDKTYEGAVETIAQIGTTSNNVTNYDVVVSIKDPSGIKLGMNANVTITTESKENALVIPAEALVETNGQKFVRVDDTSTASGSNTQGENGNESSQSGSNQTQSGNGQGRNGQATNAQNGAQAWANSGKMQGTTSSGKLVAIKTGLETQNYIEVTEGLTEGQKVLVKMPSASSSSNSNSGSRNSQGGFGNMGGFGGGMPQGGGFPQGGQRN